MHDKELERTREILELISVGISIGISIYFVYRALGDDARTVRMFYWDKVRSTANRVAKHADVKYWDQTLV